ncbi:MAG: hypothetical protein ACR2PQ_04110 [Myxococcota bacterium]
MAVCLAVPLLLSGCNARKMAWEFGRGMTDMTVTSSTIRGPYLDAVVEGEGVTLRSFTPASAACSEILRADATVDYVERGWGLFRRGELECHAVGIAEPWLARTQTTRSGQLSHRTIPRTHAHFSTLFEDADVIMLRGRFPLARLVGWAGTADTVAVIAQAEGCRPSMEGIARMEYRPTARITLSLVGANGLCRIEGLIQPPPPDLAPEADSSAQ